jgi:hypothetical protein
MIVSRREKWAVGPRMKQIDQDIAALERKYNEAAAEHRAARYAPRHAAGDHAHTLGGLLGLGRVCQWAYARRPDDPLLPPELDLAEHLFDKMLLEGPAAYKQYHKTQAYKDVLAEVNRRRAAATQKGSK